MWLVVIACSSRARSSPVALIFPRWARSIQAAPLRSASYPFMSCDSLPNCGRLLLKVYNLLMIHEMLRVGPLGCNCSIFGDEETREGMVVDPGDNISGIL